MFLIISSPKFTSILKSSYGSSNWSMKWSVLCNVASCSEWPTLMKLLMARQIRGLSEWSWSISAIKSTWNRRRKKIENHFWWKKKFWGHIGVFNAKKLVLRIMFRGQQQVTGRFWKTKYECQKESNIDWILQRFKKRRLTVVLKRNKYDNACVEKYTSNRDGNWNWIREVVKEKIFSQASSGWILSDWTLRQLTSFEELSKSIAPMYYKFQVKLWSEDQKDGRAHDMASEWD